VIVRFVATERGVHVRVAVFTASQPDGVSVGAHLAHASFQMVGELTLRPDEWWGFRRLIMGGPDDVELPRDGSLNIEVATDPEK